MLLELSPLDSRFELMIGTMYGLANAGKTNRKGMPGLLQLAMIGREADPDAGSQRGAIIR